MYNFAIQSYRGQYKVSFFKTIISLSEKIEEDDYLIIDRNVLSMYPLFEKYTNKIVVDALESNKNPYYSLEIINTLISSGFKRKNKVVAIGGGIVQDITGFVSSILFRGIDWHFVPTTLLAQADSCIGSKTSLNLGSIKNTLGTFHPPREIYSCSDFLVTLEKKDIKSGIGEMLHYFLIENKKVAIDMMSQYEDLINNPSLKMGEYIQQSLKIKSKIIEVDEFDTNIRRIFNYGHTFGHAIESITSNLINHGQAVTKGIDIANWVSYKLGHISYDLYLELYKIIEKNIPTFQLDNIEQYIQILKKDKKNLNKESIFCILLDGKTAVTEEIDIDDLKNILESYNRKRVEY